VSDLEYIFHPRSIAVVGASTNPRRAINRFFLYPLLEFGFQGKIYPVNPGAEEIAGLRAYPSIADIPGPVDHVTCAIKASLTPQLMRQCAAKGVKLVQIYTSGFSETGREEGIRLEKEIAAIAREGNVRVLGPNCMGIYCPSSRISYEDFFAKESGCVAFLSQSGGNSIETVQFGNSRGVYFSKVVSYGNACDINEAELLEYFAEDEQTRIITAYIEGTRDGRRLLRALQQATRVKPVILLKGGITEAGRKAAASHTGALAGSAAVWESLFRQIGVVSVDDLEELIDLAVLFQHLKPVRGRRLGVVGSGGGASVLITDRCEKEWLSIPLFPEELQGRIREIVPEEDDPGTIVRNPVDFSTTWVRPGVFPSLLEVLDRYDGIDLILIYLGLWPGGDEVETRVIESVVETKKKLGKPVVMVLRYNHAPQLGGLAVQLQKKCALGGLPVLTSFRSVTRALNRFISYHEWREKRLA
jgi:acyl-CoA synthetase (NDP forming)